MKRYVWTFKKISQFLHRDPIHRLIIKFYDISQAFQNDNLVLTGISWQICRSAPAEVALFSRQSDAYRWRVKLALPTVQSDQSQTGQQNNYIDFPRVQSTVRKFAKMRRTTSSFPPTRSINSGEAEINGTYRYLSVIIQQYVAV